MSGASGINYPVFRLKGGNKMLNITLTFAAAPELLAAISSFTNSITSTKVVSVPKAAENINQIYNQGNTTPVNSINNQPAAVPVSMVQVPVQTPVPQNAAVPTASQTYTMEQLAVAATQLVDAGRRAELVNLLQTFGVQALATLPKEQYGAFAAQLRTLGAKIDNLCVQNRNSEGAKI
jgi:hypothetical protein